MKKLATTTTTTTHWALALALFLTAHAVSAEQAPELAKHDRLKIAIQKICPVSGIPLVGAGVPSKVKVGEEEIFLCCKGCANGQISKEHWKTIHINFAQAQGMCPVMEKPLPAKPKFTVAKGQIIYICCPPCTKKIQAEPGKFVAKVGSYYEQFLKNTKRPAATAKTSAAAGSPAVPADRDQLRMAIQGICPVSGNDLGGMGQPIKARAGQIDVYLCCEGCKEGKISKKHWATIRGNLANAQGICPVMEKKLPANAKSAVVNRQLVFVCCPPCTKKIEDDPQTHLHKVDAYYRNALRSAKRPAGFVR